MQLHLWLDTGATIGIAAGAAVVAAVATFLVMFFLGKSKKSSATKAADGIIKDANLKAERIIKNAQLDAKQAAFEAKQQSENDARARKAEIAVEQQKLDLRQAAFDERESRLLKKEEDLENKSASLDASLESYKKRKEELDAKIDDIIKELEKVSGMSVQEAHDEIMARVESRMSMEISAYIKNQKLIAAANMLIYSDYPIAEIAGLYNFSSQSHFTNSFQEKYGTTPKKYRDEFSNKTMLT